MGGDQVPREYEMMLAIKRYGAQAVMGRALGVREIRQMAYIENRLRDKAKREAANGE